MSYCLTFRKGGVEILSLGTGHCLSTAFENKPWTDEWKKMSKSEFANATVHLIREDESLINDIDIYNRMLEGISNFEERYDLIARIKDLERERKEVAKAKIMLGMLKMIWEEGECTNNEDNVGLEWRVS